MYAYSNPDQTDSDDVASLLETLDEWLGERQPTPTTEFVAELLGILKKEGLLVLSPATGEVSPQIAGEMLGVSRPHVYRLLEEGVIPFTSVGKHRKIRTEDVEAYKLQLEQARSDLAEMHAGAASARARILARET